MKLHFKASNFPERDRYLSYLNDRYNSVPLEDADYIVCLGGDGFLLESIHDIVNQNIDVDIPIYGMNMGTVGFLLNEVNLDLIVDNIENSKKITLYPLITHIKDAYDNVITKHAFNEVSLYRQSKQAAKIGVSINFKSRIDEIIGDGILLSTPAGSTAYNRSAGGPIVPLNGNLLPLTPICPFRPRNWKGALIPFDSLVRFDIHEQEKRPVSVVADSFEIRNASCVTCNIDRQKKIHLLFNDKNCLEERIFSEQFWND